MRRLDYIPACLNLCPLTTFYEGDHNGCQKKKQQQKSKTKTKTKRQPVRLCEVLNYAQRSIADF